jgi:N-methylhydantoinase A
MSPRYKAACDVGGTFTDFVVFDESSGELLSHKLPSTPKDPSAAVIEGFRQIQAQLGVPLGEISLFVHGNTLGVNTVIQRNGARVAVLVTRGFRDVLELARMRLPMPFHMVQPRPEPLVARARVREIVERTDTRGRELTPLDRQQAARAIDQVRAEGVDAIAIALLNSYVNPEHEQQLAALVRERFPDAEMSVSSELWPEMREYERTIVAVMNAYIHPTLDHYIQSLLAGMRDIGVPAELYITRSNGGMMTAESARQWPVHTLLSGPASGVVGAAFVARLAGEPACVGLDMGGTSADVSLVRDGEAVYSSENHVGDFPVVMPSVDVSAIGAGGGSIAWLDQIGILHVGPKSAGADPGPACYDRGGTQPTVTDAYLVCGYINPDNFIGGRITLHPRLAKQAIRPIAERLGKSVVDTAESILAVATSNMATELLPLMAKKGVDPRDFALIAYGGAGPTHAARLAQETRIGKILVPPSPGTLCALGALMTDVRSDYIKTVRDDLAAVDAQMLRSEYARLEREALEWVRTQGSIIRQHTVTRSADMRYRGEPYDVDVMLPRETPLEEVTPELLRELFHTTHQKVYNFMDREAAVRITNIRVRVSGQPQLPSPRELQPAAGEPTAVGRREMYYGGSWHSARVYDRAELRAGHQVVGPAIVEQLDTTTVVPPGFAARMDRCSILSLTAASGAEPAAAGLSVSGARS